MRRSLAIVILVVFCLIFSNIVVSINSSESSSGWVQVIGENGDIDSGFGTSSNFATRGMCVYNEELYIGTQNMELRLLRYLPLKLVFKIIVPVYRALEAVGNARLQLRIANMVLPLLGIFCQGCELWKYNSSLDEWAPLISDADGSILPAGFGFRKNFAIAVIKEFKGYLYIGTATSSLFGCELWKYDGTNFEKIIGDGFGNRFNTGIWSIEEYNNELYIGTMNWKNGFGIWKSSDGSIWEQVDLPYGNGFGIIQNVYAWSMNKYNNSLLLGTCNLDTVNGAQLWSYNGSNWTKMILPGGDGFGTASNYGIRNMVEYQDSLFVSTAANVFHEDAACEIWKYKDDQWACIIGRTGEINQGFGNVYNKYAWSMLPTSDGKLWVGTWNMQSWPDAKPLNTVGCEIWLYDGANWSLEIGDGTNISGGFDNLHNLGARSMIEYPEGSNALWVGTFNLDIINFKTFNGCEIWKKS